MHTINYSIVNLHKIQQSKYFTQGTCNINEAISDLKMSTNILQGVLSLMKVCTDTHTEDNNRNFGRGYSTEFFWVFFVQHNWVATKQAGAWIYFLFSSHSSDFYYFYFVRVLWPNITSMIRIVEYSTFSVLEYFKDTLDNVVLPLAWLE